jgi:polar amino acid transport system substrate-binding protein
MGVDGIARRAAVVVAAALALSACGGSDSPETGGDPATDKLAQVLARGTLILSTDLEYPPQSYRVDAAARSSETKCAGHQLTGGQVTGYDAETGKLVASALGVEPCFVNPRWTEIVAGNWGDRWDIAFGSGSIDADRMQRLYMTQPYYATPAYLFVRRDSGARSVADLDGQRVGVCASCTHEQYLQGTLAIPGEKIRFRLDRAEPVGYNVERPGLEALGRGEIDAFLAQAPVGKQAIDEGLPLRVIREPLFFEYASGFVDRSSGLDSIAFLERVNGIVAQLHAEGKLRALSRKYFDEDYTAEAAGFELDALGQKVP